MSIRLRLTLWYTAVLVIVLAVISALSYSVLRWSLLRDLDASLLAVAQVIRDTAPAAAEPTLGPQLEALLREILGPEYSDKLFELRDSRGAPGPPSTSRRLSGLPLSSAARANGARGFETFETVSLAGRDRVRLLTLPIVRAGQVAQLVQVGIPLQRTEQALRRYLETLLALVPVGVGLATIGGAAIARNALRPVDVMSQTARRITGEDLSGRVPSRGVGDEIDRLADTLNAMLDRLQGAFGQLQRFTAVAAHELRTPLTVLKGGMEVALRADRSAEEYRRVLMSSLEEVEHLIHLGEDLLLFSRVSSGLDVPRSPVELESVLLDATEAALRLAEGTGVTVRIGELTPVAARGDAAALRRTLMNLVENAVKYTPAGGLVELSLTAERAEAALTVRDTGSGIDPSDVQRIFEPFVRLDAAQVRNAHGAGLGLSIARSIVLAHGGTLAVESTPGVGSAFTIRLPLA